ncbi:MAG: RecQ family ATP-dependent DNA helicase [Armatimonadota bacterium]
MDPNQLLQQYFGYDTFRPGQREVMSALWRKSAALAVFPTGGGKSLCYQLPSLMFEGVTLVVSPLIALMKDQIDYLQGRGVPAARLDSTLGAEAVIEVREQLRSGTLKLLYVAPERFNNERFLTLIQGVKIALFAVDEAHCISEWGHNFRPDYLKLAEAARKLRAERVLALTATATPAVVRDICAGFQIPHECAVVTGFYRPNLEMVTSPVTPQTRDALLLSRLQQRPPGPTIVYVTLQKTAERVAALLHDAGLPGKAYHAGMDDDVRAGVQDWWMASDRGIVVATIAFGMGIDKSDVRYIYHYNLPKGLESYSQEIGRAGRDGRPSTVELFACPEDMPVLENFAYGDTPTEDALRGLLREVLTAGEEFAVSLYELSQRHDLRLLVLRTALTYLELLGVLRQGTPFYAGYEARPLVELDDIIAQFPGEPGEFLEKLFRKARKGRIWYAFDPAKLSMELRQPRRRITKALEVLEERDLCEVRASDIRQHYYRLHEENDADALCAELSARFQKREAQEIARVAKMLALAEHDGCQVNALVGYFGEERAEPCGHCTYCHTGKQVALPPRLPQSPLPAGIDMDAVRALYTEYPQALGHPRQRARFLCGLSSPALVQAKLTRHKMFGCLEDRHFTEVLAWCTEG